MVVFRRNTRISETVAALLRTQFATKIKPQQDNFLLNPSFKMSHLIVSTLLAMHSLRRCPHAAPNMTMVLKPLESRPLSIKFWQLNLKSLPVFHRYCYLILSKVFISSFWMNNIINDLYNLHANPCFESRQAVEGLKPIDFGS